MANKKKVKRDRTDTRKFVCFHNRIGNVQRGIHRDNVTFFDMHLGGQAVAKMAMCHTLGRTDNRNLIVSAQQVFSHQSPATVYMANGREGWVVRSDNGMLTLEKVHYYYDAGRVVSLTEKDSRGLPLEYYARTGVKDTPQEALAVYFRSYGYKRGDELLKESRRARVFAHARLAFEKMAQKRYGISPPPPEVDEEEEV